MMCEEEGTGVYVLDWLRLALIHKIHRIVESLCYYYYKC